MIPASPPLAGDPSRLGRYTLLGRLGHGGMGVVYLGRDEDGRMVAIKVIRPELAADPDYLARFRREVELGRKVNQRFVAEVLDAGVDSDRPYLVTAYFEGPTLQALVRERGPMSPSEVGLLAVGVAAALSAIHAAGLVHRDLKPGNVLLSAAGPRVIDFGVARAVNDRSGPTTGAGRPGTPEFMAPEQLDGAPVGPAADVFAWGGLLVYASTGRPPFGGKRGAGGLEALERRVRYQQPDLGLLDSALRELVGAAMAKLPSGRPTAQALVLRLLDGGPSTRDLQAAATERVERHWVSPVPAPDHPEPAPPAAAAAGLGGVTRGRDVTGWLRTVAGDPAARLPLATLAGFVAVAVVLVWSLFHGIAAHLGAILVIGLEGALAIAGLVGGGWALARLARRRLDLSIGLGMLLLVITITLPVSGYQGLNGHYWVAFDHEGLSLLKGAGPEGYGPFHLHNATVVERFGTHREDLPALVTGMLDRGVEVAGRSQGRQAARCLPLLFTPAPDQQPGASGGTEPCAERLFEDPPIVAPPRQVTLPVASEHPPALLAWGGRVVLLAWTDARDRRVHLRSSTDGSRFGSPVTLPAAASGSPALAGDGRRVYLAWTRDDGRLAIASSADGERFGSVIQLEYTSGSAPALAYGDGRLLLGWRDASSNHLHLAVSLDGAHFREETILEETSDLAPTLAFADHTWVLSWIGRADATVNLLVSTDGERFGTKTVLEATSEYTPAVAAGDVWVLAWTRSQTDTTGLLVSRSGGARFVNELELTEPSAGPSLASFGGHLLLAWHERGARPAIHVATVV
jgi:Protein kinase domain